MAQKQDRADIEGQVILAYHSIVHHFASCYVMSLWHSIALLLPCFIYLASFLLPSCDDAYMFSGHDE